MEVEEPRAWEKWWNEQIVGPPIYLAPQEQIN
jgi:hypothetical protein